MTETAIKAAGCKALRELGYVVLRLQAGRVRHNVHGAPAGTPDTVVVLGGGRVLWLEWKAPGGRLSEVQRFAHMCLRNLGHRVSIVSSVREALAEVERARG